MTRLRRSGENKEPDFYPKPDLYKLSGSQAMTFSKITAKRDRGKDFGEKQSTTGG